MDLVITREHPLQPGWYVHRDGVCAYGYHRRFLPVLRVAPGPNATSPAEALLFVDGPLYIMPISRCRIARLPTEPSPRDREHALRTQNAALAAAMRLSVLKTRHRVRAILNALAAMPCWTYSNGWVTVPMPLSRLASLSGTERAVVSRIVRNQLMAEGFVRMDRPRHLSIRVTDARDRLDVAAATG